MTITPDILQRFSPNTHANLLPVVSDNFNLFSDKYEVNTPLRIASFFAQVIHESNAFKATTEYASGAEYEGRLSLGNNQKGDGMKFKGRGLIQVTGRNNYAAVSHYLYNDAYVLLDNPEKLAEYPGAMQSAFWYWTTRNLNKYADMGIEGKVHSTIRNKDYTPQEWVCLIVNGGFNGLSERINNYNRICDVLNLPHWKGL